MRGFFHRGTVTVNSVVSSLFYMGTQAAMYLLISVFKFYVLYIACNKYGVMGHVNSFMMFPRIMSTWHFHCSAWVNYVWVLMTDILNLSIMNSFKPFFYHYFYVLSKFYARNMLSVGMKAPKHYSIIQDHLVYQNSFRVCLRRLKKASSSSMQDYPIKVLSRYLYLLDIWLRTCH